MTTKVNKFLTRGTTISFTALLVSVLVNIYTMPTKPRLCMAGDYCDVYRVGAYYWNLGSFYSMIVTGIIFVVFSIFYLRSGERLRYVLPAVITPRDTKGRIYILLFLLVVWAAYVFAPTAVECKPGFHLATGTDSQFCKAND